MMFQPPIVQTIGRRNRGGDNPPALVMMAASEAGCTIDEFMALPAYEYDYWTNHVIGGASQMRTQLLLVNLIQIVSGALGGKGLDIKNFLPYFAEIYNEKPVDKKQAFHRGVKNTIEGLLDIHIKDK